MVPSSQILIEATPQGCSYEKMFWQYADQICRRIPIPKCDINKVKQNQFTCLFPIIFTVICNKCADASGLKQSFQREFSDRLFLLLEEVI